MVSSQIRETIEAARIAGYERRVGYERRELDQLTDVGFLQLVSQTEGQVETASELRRKAAQDPASADELRRRSTELFQEAISAWKDMTRTIRGLTDRALNKSLEVGSSFRGSADERELARGELDSRLRILVNRQSTYRDLQRDVHGVSRSISPYSVESKNPDRHESARRMLRDIAQEELNAEINLGAAEKRYRLAEESWKAQMEIFAKHRFIAQMVRQCAVAANGLELNIALEYDKIRIEAGEIKTAKFGFDHGTVISVQESNIKAIKEEEAVTEEAEMKVRSVIDGISSRYGSPLTVEELKQLEGRGMTIDQLTRISDLRATIASQPFITLATYAGNVTEKLGNTTLFAAFWHDTRDGTCKISWASGDNSRHSIRAAEDGRAVISIARTSDLPGWGSPAGASFDVTVRRLEDPEEVARAMFANHSAEQRFYGKEFPSGVNPQAVLNYSGDSGVSMYEATIHRISVIAAIMEGGQILNKSVPLDGIPHDVILGL